MIDVEEKNLTHMTNYKGQADEQVAMKEKKSCYKVQL